MAETDFFKKISIYCVFRISEFLVITETKGAERHNLLSGGNLEACTVAPRSIIHLITHSLNKYMLNTRCSQTFSNK